ncbi:MAG TPA: chemotaxis protein CheA [Chloroflexota bacterium]|nr:chemotaxis protein CheA [Chloroflexota bacterium]
MTQRFDATSDELSLFLAETAEQLAEVERCLIRLEEGAEPTELVAELFRNAHSLKGSAAAIGHHRMASLAHALESAMERHRTGGAPVTADHTDAYLAVVDALSRLSEEVASGEESGVDPDRYLQLLASTGQGAAAPPGAHAGAHAPEPSPGPAGASRSVDGLVELTVSFQPDEPMAAVRAIQLLLRAAEIGSVVASRPSMADLERDRFSGHVALTLRSDLPSEEIADALRAVPGVADIALADRRDTAAAEPAPDASADEPAARRAESAEERAAAKDVQTVRIDVARLDALMALVGELVIDRTRIAQIAARLEARYGGDGAVEELGVAATHLERISADLQAEVMKSRLLPVDTVFSRFPRLVRDVARRLGKEVHLEITGRETELDRSVIEEVADPLVHLIRNAIDHGVEAPEAREAAGKPRAGSIRLSARHEEGHIVVELEDDGKGIDPQAVGAAALSRGLLGEETLARMSDQEKIDLIFLPGFSLAQGVTDLSGRGVGMDVVRSNVQRLKGSVAIRSTRGKGTCITVKLPLTLAILRALLVGVAGQRFAIPLTAVVETLRLRDVHLRRMGGADVVRVRGDVLPILRLQEALRLRVGPRPEAGVGPRPEAGADGKDDRAFVVAVQTGSRQFGLIVDDLIGEQEIVVKPIGSLAGDIVGISGATILGDGRVAPILDVNTLIQDATHGAAAPRERTAPTPPAELAPVPAGYPAAGSGTRPTDGWGYPAPGTPCPEPAALGTFPLSEHSP